MTLFEVNSWEERYLLEKENTTSDQFKEDCKDAAIELFEEWPDGLWADPFEVAQWLVKYKGYKELRTTEENKVFSPRELNRELILSKKKYQPDTDEFVNEDVERDK